MASDSTKIVNSDFSTGDTTDTDVSTADGFEDKCIKRVLSCKKEAQDFYEEKFRKFNYYDRLYIKGAAKTNVPYGRANLELPLVFQQIEPFVSQMTETMVGESPYLAYEGRNIDDDKTAEDITDFTQYQLDNGHFVPIFISYLRNLGKYGTAIMKVNWETKTITIPDQIETQMPDIDPDTLQPKVGDDGKPVMKTVTVPNDQTIKQHDGPMFYNVSIFDFFVPKSATSANVQDHEWNIHRTYRSLEDLLNQDNYKRAHKKIKELIKDSEVDDSAKPTSAYAGGTLGNDPKRYELIQKNQKGLKKYSDKVEVLEWWGEYKWKDGEMSKPTLLVVAVIGDEKVLLRCDENPFKFKFKPFLMSNDYPVDGEPYGYGEIDHIKGLVEESTALRNARLDVSNISLNRVWLVERQAGVNVRELYTAPNKIILTNDLNGIKPLDMGQVTPSSVQELAKIDYDIQNTTEIINPRQDVSNVGAAFGSTATGVNFLSAKSNLRLLTKARVLEETFFKPLAQMLNWLNKDLVTDEMYYRVMGQDEPDPWRTLGPDAFMTDVDFKPTSNPQKLSMAQRKDNMSYLLQVVAQIEKVTPGTNNMYELLKEVYKISGFSHPEKYVNPPQTTILHLPNGQLADKQGKPVQVVPVDETGKPIQMPPPGAPGGPQG